MKEQIINKETALLAKEKGFDWECKLFFTDKDLSNDVFYVSILKNYNVGNQYSLCTQSLLQKWLRDVHNIDIEVSTRNNTYNVLIFKNKMLEDFLDGFSIYEKSLEEGLKVALTYVNR